MPHFALASCPQWRDVAAMTESTPQNDPVKRGKLVAGFIEAMPYARALGMRVEKCEGGEASIAMDYDEALVGDPESGVIHGGAVSALMDTCAGAAVMSHPRASILTATLDLRIDYMRPASPGQVIRTEATCYHVTRSVAFVRAVTYDADDSRPVATANGAFTVDHKT